MAADNGTTFSEGMYSKLIDSDNHYDELHTTDVREPHVVHISPVRGNSRQPFKLATACLAGLCVILLLALVVVSSQRRAASEVASDPAQSQRQANPMNITELTEKIKTLEQEKTTLEQNKNTLEEDKKTLLEEQATLEQSKIALEEDKMTLYAEKKVLEEGRKTLEEEKKRLEAENSALQEKIKDFEDAFGPLTTVAPAPPTPKAVEDTECPDGWHRFIDSCYYISEDTRDWPDSQRYCQRKGGHLAIIHTAEEQTFIWERLRRGHWRAYWFGITDEKLEGKWHWVDGTELVGGFWEDGEPNNHINEDCGYIVKTEVLSRIPTKSWYDAPCDMHWRFVCEKELTTTTQ
ncbi:C-type lectin domain family 4 member M [Engraulis encrasicolus]|uniref:C-type lectin domain family 4 member M n=1 Tax=Engraulis encrasicolus TaxID=184585 RepID=UPI002FCE7E41